MEVLTRDFLVVYHVNLLKNASTLIKADPNVANYDSVKASLRQTNQYRERMEIYCANYVIPDLRVEFGRVMEAGSLLERLRHTPRFVYRYRTMPHKQDQQYFEVQALRLQSTMDSGEILIAFRCIDDVVTAQQRRQIELEEQIEQERNQIELLQALGRNYYSIFRIDLEDDSYTEISCREEGRGFFDSAEPSAQKTLDGLCQSIIAPRYLERMRSQPQRYDAILMDMQMPNMDGVEATQLIRALPIARATEIPIIAMTANALGDDVRKCLSAGMDIHLSKPMDMARLISALHALVKPR